MLNYKIGDTIQFGRYPQDSDGEKQEPVEWQVLAEDGDRILVISKHALDCKPYNDNERNAETTWEKCSLRQWLNDGFYSAAFSAEEQSMILTTHVSVEKNPGCCLKSGNVTNDKMFVLSIAETEKYFPTDESRKCVPTVFAFSQGAYTDSNYSVDGKATCWWWLRSPGDRPVVNSHVYAAYVDRRGRIWRCGDFVCNGQNCVRPAMWIKVES